MKTKTEIRNQIQHLYKLKRESREIVRQNGYPITMLEQPFQIVDYAIASLKWVLGYKTNFKGKHYYCFRCKWMHNDITCPKCGGDTVMQGIEE